MGKVTPIDRPPAKPRGRRVGTMDEYGTIWHTVPGVSAVIGDVVSKEDEETHDIYLIPICFHLNVHESANTNNLHRRNDHFTHWKCEDCGDLFPLIGDTDEWLPKPLFRECAQQPCSENATEAVNTNYGLLGFLCKQHMAELRSRFGA